MNDMKGTALMYQLGTHWVLRLDGRHIISIGGTSARMVAMWACFTAGGLIVLKTHQCSVDNQFVV